MTDEKKVMLLKKVDNPLLSILGGVLSSQICIIGLRRGSTALVVSGVLLFILSIATMLSLNKLRWRIIRRLREKNGGRINLDWL